MKTGCRCHSYRGPIVVLNAASESRRSKFEKTVRKTTRIPVGKRRVKASPLHVGVNIEPAIRFFFSLKAGHKRAINEDAPIHFTHIKAKALNIPRRQHSRCQVRSIHK